MPSSDFSQISAVVELIILCQPMSVLDIGCGFGKYGVLAREYLELWDGRERYSAWTRRIDAIEAFEPYITPLHRFIYDHVYVGDAVNTLMTLDLSYDLVLLVDVLEHLDRTAGALLLRRAAERGRNMLIATPKNPGEQGAAFENPGEAHRSRWTNDDFSGLVNPVILPHPHSLLVFAGEAAPRVWKARISARLSTSKDNPAARPVAPEPTR
ncbi:class I SAM-dependent methyltransferase [Candidatus Fermentibacteria bacterium]|nr:class I SAM-dependent methyltransferase [Candidatus Fermentibacteria bacterium]